MNKNSVARKISFLGLLMAISVVLGIFESMIPPIPMLPPGIKPGLANIVVMYTLLCMSKKDTAIIVVIKSLFVLLTRGAVAGLMSFAGGTFSAVVMLIMLLLFKDKISLVMVSIVGAVFHNIAQICVAVIVLGTNMVFAYLPVLIIAGVILGYITGFILKIVMPAVSRINPYMT